MNRGHENCTLRLRLSLGLNVTAVRPGLPPLQLAEAMLASGGPERRREARRMQRRKAPRPAPAVAGRATGGEGEAGLPSRMRDEPAFRSRASLGLPLSASASRAS